MGNLEQSVFPILSVFPFLQAPCSPALSNCLLSAIALLFLLRPNEFTCIIPSCFVSTPLFQDHYKHGVFHPQVCFLNLLWFSIWFPVLPEKKVVGLERGPLNLMSTTEELLDRKVAAPA
jgi:hypothetical protein